MERLYENKTISNYWAMILIIANSGDAYIFVITNSLIAYPLYNYCTAIIGI